ncbi:MAG: 30S ribosomal protein S17 [Candidatus Phytoplasma asteris]|uniref:Small ribosomal subunit protein uS17 n=6 Tax=16SrI (Aster yellows group) TaxID=3042590 RepID=RS17_ONYPE|nr:RecName: Full=Small ribosomal subunit protein uS17; AltName: Full=30S ribosomal protein S17 [Onion yellows phytoplasma OY-M]OIJ44822.1 30S ribosomal protein S17 [Rice orange leaf phytoplasma]PWV43801.1 MAG: 30S ribosomal protein S17 ['Brassica napus' phytoplasma]QKX95383.1 MAG: 30S ribosomal protein S17 [Rapeseed phyllody phytoplasma]TKA87582.1 MAG: 30S ribosomal protein S17 [Periwinkle leaf yellowing phytoplasma]WEX19941.1 MAG: 30S ribosomal protein S17 [Candidatus Phytoplasma asteris]GAK
MQRNFRKTFVGKVVSDKMDKTITVIVDIYKKDPLYGKRVKQSKKFHVHDENQEAKPGDLVNFMETRPLSKTKRFRLFKILSHAKSAK